MKEKILGGTLALLVAAVGIMPVNAASNRVEIVSESAGAKTVATDGTSLLNTINTEKTNLVNGTVAIDITLQNSKALNAYYAFNNDTALDAVKENLVAHVSNLASNLEDKNVRQAVVYNTSLNFIKTKYGTDDKKPDFAEFLSSETYATNGETIVKLLNNLSVLAANDSSDYIFLFLSTLPALTAEEQAQVVAKVNEIKATGALFRVYSVNSTDAEAYLSSLFGDTDYALIDPSEVCATTVPCGYNKIKFDQIVESGFTAEKNDVTTEILLDDYITDNFEIKDLAVTKGTIAFDADAKKISASSVDLERNEDYKITYILQIKSEIDSTKVDYELRTNKQVHLTYSSNGSNVEAYLPETNRIDDDKCYPIIKILKEAVDNPYTGVYDYIVAGSCMLAVALVTLAILNKKKYEL